MPRRLAFLLGAAALTACVAPGKTPEEQAIVDAAEARRIAPATRETRAAVAHEDVLTQTAFWAEEYERNPAELEAAQQFARLLRATGQNARAATIANHALALHPDDVTLLSTLGAALIADGRAGAAVDPLERAERHAPENPDVLVRLAAAYDHVGKSDAARARYARALIFKGEDPAILTNLALSHLLSGDPASAERYLRRAAELPGADARVRQNLALALALQGEFAEAETLAQQDQGVDAAAANVAGVRAMMTQPRSWDAMRSVE